MENQNNDFRYSTQSYGYKFTNITRTRSGLCSIEDFGTSGVQSLGRTESHAVHILNRENKSDKKALH
jgi:hypothetical protein